MDTPLPDRALLEYHIDTLTNRGEEQPFETFGRRLAERIICPNLLPHTGGDSKVDPETYPVCEAIALAWFVGTETLAATEGCAFAFSAKREWRPKLKSDIAKIIATDRRYSKAFFVSSQYIPDKARAAAEDELRNAYGIDVRILDRTWILDRIFGDRLEELAIQELGISTSVRREIAKGLEIAKASTTFRRWSFGSTTRPAKRSHPCLWHSARAAVAKREGRLP